MKKLWKQIKNRPAKETIQPLLTESQEKLLKQRRESDIKALEKWHYYSAKPFLEFFKFLSK